MAARVQKRVVQPMNDRRPSECTSGEWLALRHSLHIVNICGVRSVKSENVQRSTREANKTV
jgi:hypothetical protein